MSLKFWLIIIGLGLTSWKAIINPKKTSRFFHIVLAVLIFVVFVVLAIVNIRDDETSQREQRATHILNQEQAAALHRVGFEFVLKDVQDTVDITYAIMLRTWIYLESFPRLGNLKQMTIFFFSGNTVLDSITNTPERSVGRHNTEIIQEIDSNVIRVWFDLYGLDFEGKMYWKPKTVAELQQLNFNITVIQRDQPITEWFTWSAELCPVEEVRIYGNEFQPKNLLVRTKLVANRKSSGRTNYFGYYPVNGELGKDSSNYLFQIKSEWQYSSILNALKNE